MVRRGLEPGAQLALMGLASATVAIVVHCPPAEPAFGGEPADRILEQVVLRYVEHGSPDALAYAAALTALVPSGAMRSRLRAALDGSEDDLPRWLAEIDDARLESTTVVRDLFDDDEWLLGGVRFSDGGSTSFRVSIDHGADGAVVDAALMHQTVDEVLQQLRGGASEDEVRITEVTPDELARRYADAIAIADSIGDGTAPARSDTWPNSRPLIDWALQLEPGDGTSP